MAWQPQGVQGGYATPSPYPDRNQYDEKNPNNGGMNGFKDHMLDEDAFGAKGGIVSAFDVFPKSKPQYVTHTAGGGKWTVIMFIVSSILVWSELATWWRGSETHTFAVEKSVLHHMQINLDVVVRMQCPDLHVNVQDAAGDRILAASMLKRDPTNWAQWVDAKGMHRLNRDDEGRLVTGEGWMAMQSLQQEGFGEEHVHDIIATGRRRARWGKTPRLWGGKGDSCRIYGSLDLNRVQGDFHITARGHGYTELGEHLDHATGFNFSHIVSELSFGEFYPSLENPLDMTVNTASANFHKFQYFMSVVPTVYSVGRTEASSSRTLLTNQYAVTEQSSEVSDRVIPGIFFKYDIEPILLVIEESRDSILVFLVKVINLLSGAFVACQWGFMIMEWIKETWGKRKRSTTGMLDVGKTDYED